MKIMANLITCILTLLFSLALQAQQDELTTADMSGLQLMQEVQRRHEQYPYVYEEQVMVLTDKNGHRNTRKLSRYSRINKDGSANYLLLFHYPDEIHGVGLLAQRLSNGQTQTQVYLPALGEQLIDNGSDSAGSHFLGSDFTLESLQSEDLEQFAYQRLDNQRIDKIDYYVVRARKLEFSNSLNKTLKHHYIRQDNFYISRTDFFDHKQQLQRRQSQHDLVSLGALLWRANMILVEDFTKQHSSLLKISRRVFSQDYVPKQLFSLQWLTQNHRYRPPVLTEEAL